jgi:hypothetical protein
MALFSTNPYNNFQAANSKEYIILDKVTKQDFKPEACFDLIPGNSNPFLAEKKRSIPRNLAMELHSMSQPIVTLILLMQMESPTRTQSI